MTESSFPFDSQDTTEGQYTRLFREAMATGVADIQFTNPLQVTNPSGLSLSVAAGFAVLRGHGYLTDTAVSLTAPAADVSNPRIDLVTLKLDPSADSIVLGIKQGTAAASPVAPTLTQTDTAVFELALASYRINAGASSLTALTDLRTYAGLELYRWSTASRDLTPRRVGDIGYNTTTSQWEWYAGSGTYNPLFTTTATNSTQWNGYQLVVSATDPGTPSTNRIWIQTGV